MVRVIAFTGMPGAGKSEAVAIAKGLGLPVIRMGEFVWEETRRRGLPLDDQNVGRVATDMRRTRGMDYWAQATCEAIERQHASAPLVVVDGVRNHEEVGAFRKRLGDRFELVAILSATPVREDRLIRRGRSDDATTRDQVRQRDERELGWGIAESIGRADHKIVNEGNIEAFTREVGTLLERLMASTR